MKRLYRAMVRKLAAGAVVVAVGFVAPFTAAADEADAKRLLKAMSDYLAAQDMISFDFDATLEVVTSEDQKLALISSGTVTVDRPEKVRATRSGGFADIEMLFDGRVLTLLGKTENLYTQIEVAGTLDQLIDELREKYNRPLPAADLLISNPYDELMLDTVDVKDLGSGVVNGVECDHLAFRKPDVDWQIWIAQGDRPYPCLYVIASKLIAHAPQYAIEVRNWKTGDEVAAEDFTFKNPTDADKIELADLRDKVDDLPRHFTLGDRR